MATVAHRICRGGFPSLHYRRIKFQHARRGRREKMFSGRVIRVEKGPRCDERHEDDQIRRLCENLTARPRLKTYSQLYALGCRIDGIERAANRPNPRFGAFSAATSCVKSAAQADLSIISRRIANGE